MILDNTKTFLDQSGDRKRPEVLFGRKLVTDMEWIEADSYGYYELKDNLMKVFPTDIVPSNVHKDWTYMDNLRSDYSSVPIANGASAIWTRPTRRHMGVMFPRVHITESRPLH